MTESIIEDIIAEALPNDRILGYQSINISGSEAFYCETANAERILVKYQIDALSASLEAEANGLYLLSEDADTPVVRPITSGNFEQIFYLVLPWVDSDNSEAGYAFGEALAHMHQRQNTYYGLDSDNFIGDSPQSNTPNHNWVNFYRDERLLKQAGFAAKNGFSHITSQIETLCNQLESLLPASPLASLIHGDLWAGNFLTANDGEQLLIDPCVYYADREAEFGILTIFGGFNQEFYNGYTECWPFEEGFDERLPLYQLYHYLNHLNLFGTTYLQPCEEILKLYH